MPYIYVENLEEGFEEADVVERSQYAELETQLEEAKNQRDNAIERAVQAEGDYSKMREKYANTFLGKPRNMETYRDEPKIDMPQSLDELFG